MLFDLVKRIPTDENLIRCFSIKILFYRRPLPLITVRPFNLDEATASHRYNVDETVQILINFRPLVIYSCRPDAKVSVSDPIYNILPAYLARLFLPSVFMRILEVDFESLPRRCTRPDPSGSESRAWTRSL